MAARPAPESYAEEQRRTGEERSTVWAFIWTLFLFKIGTVLVIFWAADGSHEAGILLTVTTWFYGFIPVVAVAGPFAFLIRRRRVRARRARLLRAEWMLE